MIKKILLIFTFIFIMFLTTINASAKSPLKKLIICGDNPSLDVDGYKLVETNVNFNQEGLYNAVYKNEQTNTLENRIIEVVNQKTLEEGFNFIKQENSTYYADYEIKKSISTPYGIALIGIKNNKCYYLLETNGTLKNYILGTVDTLSVTELIYDEESNYVFGYGYQLINDQTNIFIVSFNEDGICMMRKSYGGTGVDQALKMIIKENSLILCGKTTSSDGVFSHTSNQEDSFILSINKYTGNTLQYLDLGVEGNDYIDQMIYLDNLYVIRHYYLFNTPCYKIIALNQNFEIIKENYINENTMMISKGIDTKDDKIYLLYDVYKNNLNKMVSCLYEVDKDLNVILINTYNEAQTTTYGLNTDYNVIRTLYHNYQTKETYLRFIMEEEIKAIKLCDEKIESAYFAGSNTIHLLTNNQIKIYTFNTLSLEDNTAIIPKVNYNNEQLNYNKNKSTDFYNHSLYGTYHLELYYELNEFDILYNKDLEIKQDLNIKTDNQYNLGLKLSFNAIGYLNDQQIESNFIITTPGEYKLDLIGYQNIKNTYVFKVVDLSVEKQEIDYYNYTLEIPKIDENKQLTIINVPTNNELKDDDYQKNLWYLLIPFLVFSVILIIYLKLRKKI